ncbi:TPA: hypothetical protein ACU8BS_000108 [Neisseria subflava]
MLIVETKEEFKKAVENKVPEFVVVGDLKAEIKKTEKLKTMSKWAITALVAGLAATPFTGGTSGLLAGAAATSTLGAAAITAIALIGVTVLIAFYQDYDYVESSLEINGVIKAGMKCTRKKH